MSSTNRGRQRSADDFYKTPAWCVSKLLEARQLPAGQWIEPAAGDGAIVRAVDRSDIDWTLCELRASERLAGNLAQHDPFAVAITNPPFSYAREFVEACLQCAETAVILLRLNFLASKTRWSFMSSWTPDVYVLPNRPSFTAGGKTDSIEYAWMVWSRKRRKRGFIQVLGLRLEG